ncbi:hypothetical protein [Lacimicrobium alkaliphilum]|uniref:Uncharacterized protein n=1 Tax=Lacimicrobium alkaliphilum TaxID=1526571 RepID=A0A0U2Z6G5_9ALTE|nr:hypothetical protein [Lacimicrobium alkaliphilum]ALS98052.1 hypothetical protein AT746_07100 [Lacimicrobium alkaliphilum]
MTNQALIKLLKMIMIVGIILIVIGVFLHFSPTVQAMGVSGILLSACCVAFGMILSLPTKIYLTFLLMKHESDKH